MARAATRLGVRQVAQLAGITPFTVSRYENEQGGLRLDTAEKLKRAFKQLGVSFLEDDGAGAGVRFQQQPGSPGPASLISRNSG